MPFVKDPAAPLGEGRILQLEKVLFENRYFMMRRLSMKKCPFMGVVSR